MRSTILTALLLCFVTSTWAATSQEDEQDHQYIRCLIKRKVNPPNIPREDNVICLKDAGIEDPGEVARKANGDAWRTCITKKSAELDDGVSPASEIAQAVIRLCPDEWRAYITSLHMAPAAKRQMSNGLERYAVEEGMRAVLFTRRAAKNSQSKP